MIYIRSHFSTYYVLLNSKKMTDIFYDFMNVIEKDPQVRIKINDMLDRYMRLPYKYQSRVGYDCLIQNIILKELINIMGTTVTDFDIEIKRKICRIKYLESKNIIK